MSGFMNRFKTVLLLGALTGLLIWLGDTFWGTDGALYALIFAALFNFGAYWFSDKIVLMSYGARPVKREEAPWLYEIVERLSRKAGIPTPPVYVAPIPQPNAFATGRGPGHAVVVVTEGILNVLDKNELEGVLAHEISHIKNRDVLISTVAATLAGAIMILARTLYWIPLFGGFGDDREGANPLAGLLLVILAPIAALLIQMAISRSREYLADETGAQISRKPLSLARALAKIAGIAEKYPLNANPATSHMFIVNPLRGGGILSLFSTHPPVEKRIERLQEIARRLGTYE